MPLTKGYKALLAEAEAAVETLSLDEAAALLGKEASPLSISATCANWTATR